MLQRSASNNLPRFKEQPISLVDANLMRNAEPSGQPAPAAIDFDLFLVVVPYSSVIEFEVNPFGYIRCFSGHHFDAGALMSTQDNGFINQAIVPKLGEHFAPKHSVSPLYLEFADFSFGSIILIGQSGF